MSDTNTRADGAQTPAPRAGRRTLKVTWHPNAVSGAVERAAELTSTSDPDGVCQVPWMDLACLLDLARHTLAEPAEGAEVAPVLDTLARVLAGDPRDWSLDRRDAWLWGVLCGWDCEDHPTTQECDETCTSALASVAERHGWNDVEVDVLRKMRATIREARRG